MFMEEVSLDLPVLWWLCIFCIDPGLTRHFIFWGAVHGLISILLSHVIIHYVSSYKDTGVRLRGRVMCIPYIIITSGMNLPEQGHIHMGLKCTSIFFIISFNCFIDLMWAMEWMIIKFFKVWEHTYHSEFSQWG